jgi:hypothetical protein
MAHLDEILMRSRPFLTGFLSTAGPRRAMIPMSTDRHQTPHMAQATMDLFFILVLLTFFLLTLAMVWLCGRI